MCHIVYFRWLACWLVYSFVRLVHWRALPPFTALLLYSALFRSLFTQALSMLLCFHTLCIYEHNTHRVSQQSNTTARLLPVQHSMYTSTHTVWKCCIGECQHLRRVVRYAYISLYLNGMYFICCLCSCCWCCCRCCCCCCCSCCYCYRLQQNFSRSYIGCFYRCVASLALYSVYVLLFYSQLYIYILRLSLKLARLILDFVSSFGDFPRWIQSLPLTMWIYLCLYFIFISHTYSHFDRLFKKMRERESCSVEIVSCSAVLRFSALPLANILWLTQYQLYHWWWWYYDAYMSFTISKKHCKCLRAN